ncbi:MAG: FAD-dependent oxidoreductase [Planctomycetes bacterium]|nr:FAD-dependent oxidoreductase [Planctomycetota bacterium]
MKKKLVDLAIIGAGPAGLAAALEARTAGVEDLLIIERDERIGGILNQCIHTGFGLRLYGEEMSGPEYIGRFIRECERLRVPVSLNTMVTELGGGRTLCAVGYEGKMVEIKTQAIILAMGCRERTRESILLPGTRPAGIFTAGTAQRLLNIEGVMPGKEIVIVGSGDIGLIMARRLTLEGAHVKAVVEIMPHPGGITRNIVQCLQDFDIPLHLRHIISEIRGRQRVTGVTAVEVNEEGNAIPGTEKDFVCDTVLVSAGLIPENELSRMAGIEIDPLTNGPVIDQEMRTSVQGIYACGDVAYVHNLVDWVTMEAQAAGRAAVAQVMGTEKPASKVVDVIPGEGVNNVAPQKLTLSDRPLTGGIAVRVKAIRRNVRAQVHDENGELLHSVKKRIVKPAEIFDIELEDLNLGGADKITISISDGESKR